MSKNDEIKATLLEVLLDPASSEQEKQQAQLALRKLSGTPEAVPEPTGATKVGNITVSESYAKALIKEHGGLDDEAIREASGRRLCDAASMSDKAKFLETFPEDEKFFDDAVTQVKAFWSDLEAKDLKLKAEREAEATNRPIEIRLPAPVEPAPEYPSAPVMGPAERALALKQLLGK